MTAMPTPYSPANAYEKRMPSTMTIAGSAVACIDTASPAMMLVACPVTDAAAMRLHRPGTCVPV